MRTWLRLEPFLQAVSIQIVHAIAAPASFGLLLLALVAIGVRTAALVKVRLAAGSAGMDLRRPVPCRPLTLTPRAVSAVRCPASHADCAPLRAPPTVRTLSYRCFERTAELSGSASGDNGAMSLVPLAAGPAVASCHDVARLRAGPA